jgi:hypothetical protein
MARQATYRDARRARVGDTPNIGRECCGPIRPAWGEPSLRSRHPHAPRREHEIHARAARVIERGFAGLDGADRQRIANASKAGGRLLR